MNRFLLSAVFVLSLVAAPVHADEVATIRAAVAGMIPGQAPDSIAPSPIAGLYEVVYGTRMFYVTADGRHLISGDLFDLQQRSNLTEAWRGKARVAALNDSAASMIVYPARGKAKHTLTIFTDIDCTYCRKLHAGMKEMNDLGITVRYLAFPRAGIPSPSYDKAVSVWCAADRNKAMDQAKNEDKVGKNTCDNNPVAAHLAMGQSFGISATPTLVLEDGTIIPGYLPPQRLVQELDGMRQAQK